MINRKKLNIPERVSGRLITNRGVHLQPFGHHGDWLNNASYWVDLLVSRHFIFNFDMRYHLVEFSEPLKDATDYSGLNTTAGFKIAF